MAEHDACSGGASPGDKATCYLCGESSGMTKQRRSHDVVEVDPPTVTCLALKRMDR